MRINITTGLITLMLGIILTCGGWAVSIAVNNTDQKNLKESVVKIEGTFVKHCERQATNEEKNAETLSEIKESLARLEERLGTNNSPRRVGRER